MQLSRPLGEQRSVIARASHTSTTRSPHLSATSDPTCCRAAFDTTWGRNSLPGDRTALLLKLADLIERDAQHLGELESVNSGKGLRIARDFDIGDTVACLRYYAGWSDKVGLARS